MLRRLPPFFVLGVWVAALPAASQEPTDQPTSYDQQSAQVGAGPAAAQGATATPTSYYQQSAQADTGTRAPVVAPPSPPAVPQPAAPPPTNEAKPEGLLEGWRTEVTGYFRAPMALGISARPGPDTYDAATDSFTGKKKLQLAYGPNRTVDASYYSFAYTRLQEQDWVEVTVHAKKKHVDAAVGWLGYWLAATGYRNLDAAWIPGIAYLKLDTDLELDPSFKPNLALTMGAFWPKFGYFEKYDTFTLGQFRQLGAQLKATYPLDSDLALAEVHGFGTGRDGHFNLQVNPLYGGVTGVDLMQYNNIQVTYKKYVDAGIHFNYEWTADPNLHDLADAASGKAYSTDASKSHLWVVGAEAGLSAPYAGRFWISPSYLDVKNGWALGQGTEVMHSLGGAGIASNYMGWNNSPIDSTGTGSMVNLGFLYENTLSNIQGKTPGSVMPEVTLNVFGLLALASLDLPPPPTDNPTYKTQVTQDSIKQLKYGADVTVQPLTWLAIMLRYDSVNMNTEKAGYIYSVITPRLVFSSHFLSGESIYIQYSHYFYGDRMVLAAKWPWGSALVAGSDVYQSSRYNGEKPDADVVKLQATVAF